MGRYYTERLPFGVVVWQPRPGKTATAADVRVMRFADPQDALACAVDYLRKGRQCRLTDATVAVLAERTVA